MVDSNSLHIGLNITEVASHVAGTTSEYSVLMAIADVLGDEVCATNLRSAFAEDVAFLAGEIENAEEKFKHRPVFVPLGGDGFICVPASYLVQRLLDNEAGVPLFLNALLACHEYQHHQRDAMHAAANCC